MPLNLIAAFLSNIT
uniref:Uncharacterized protein n=1 Tax=Rhizophora mucronata TaxID=61149 RepID=A0A2P2P637_RHIMU